jgi:hypothetical protein
MTAEEFHRRILSLLRKEPFEPFEVELTTGERFWVARHDSVATDGGAAVCGDGEDIHFFNDKNTLRLGRDIQAAAS